MLTKKPRKQFEIRVKWRSEDEPGVGWGAVVRVHIDRADPGHLGGGSQAPGLGLEVSFALPM